MTTLPTVLISGASDELTGRIEQLIRSQAELSFVSSVSPGQAASEDINAKLIWIELESDPLGNLSVLETLIKAHPTTFFVVSKEDLEPELVKKAMQIGALDFLDHKGWAAQIRSVVRRVMAKEYGSKPPAATGGRQAPASSNWNQLNNLKIQSSSSTFRRVDATKTLPALNRQPSEAERELEPLTQEQEAPAQAESLQEVITDTYSTEEIQEYSEQEYAEEGQAYSEGEEGYQYYYTEDGQLLYYTEDGQAYTEDGQSYHGLVYAQDGQVYGPDGQLYTAEGYAQEEGYTEEEGYQPEEVSSQEEVYPQEEVSSQEIGFSEEEGYAQEQGSEEIVSLEEGTVDTPEAVVSEATSTEQLEVEQPGYSEPPPGYNEDEQGYTTDTPQSDLNSSFAGEYEGSYGEESPLGVSNEFRAYHRALEESGKFPAHPAQEAEPEVPLNEPLIPQEETVVSGDTTGSTDPKATASSAAAEKGRWSDLDSIISKPKTEEKKETNKWTDLDAIATKQKSDKEPTKQSKWGELDALNKPAASKEPATGSKWGDLDEIAALGKATQEDPGSTWSEAEEIGSESSIEIGIQSSSNWSELGEITASSSSISEVPASKWGDLDSIGQRNTVPEPVANKPVGKWGELDAIGSKSAKTSFPKGDPQDEGVSRKSSGKWGELDAIQAKSTDPPSATMSKFTRKTQNIEMPQPKAQPQSLPAEPATQGNLESIPTPKPSFGPEESKWGNLDAIPTPKKGQEPAPMWGGDLDNIPTPKAEKGGPQLVEGALRMATAQSAEASKWKKGMSTEMSTGAREVGAMREKLQGSVSIKIGWGKVNWVVAAVVLVSQVYLVISFCSYQSPPAEISKGR